MPLNVFYCLHMWSIASYFTFLTYNAEIAITIRKNNRETRGHALLTFTSYSEWVCFLHYRVPDRHNIPIPLIIK